MGRRPIHVIPLMRAAALAAAVAGGLLASCGSSGPASPSGADRPVTTTDPSGTTLLETAPVTLPASARPAGVSVDAIGYEVTGTDGVWIETNGDAVAVGCTVEDPGSAIRAAGIAGYRGIWTCT